MLIAGKRLIVVLSGITLLLASGALLLIAITEPEADPRCQQLIAATVAGDSDRIHSLLAESGRVNCRSDDWAVSGVSGSATPIVIAAILGHSEVISELVEAGADVNQALHNASNPSLNGATPLILMATTVETNMLRLLVVAGADIEAVNDDGFNALFVAVSTECRECIEQLLRLGADPNSRLAKGAMTPLSFAAATKSPEIVKALLDGGADPRLRLTSGDTALGLARKRDDEHRQSIVKLLTEGLTGN
ncbi:MAG: ankyrin repeat domain-containing protein [Phycisphaerales bacterium]